MSASEVGIGDDVLLFFCPGGANALVKGEPEKIRDMHLKGLPDPAKLYEDILAEGGRVILCELALKNKGIAAEDVREGVEILSTPAFLLDAQGAGLSFVFLNPAFAFDFPGDPAPWPGSSGILLSAMQRAILVFLAICLSLSGALTATAQDTGDAIVQAVLFYSPTCPHCHDTITNFLVPLMDEYGDRLQLLGVDTSQSGGSYLYGAAIEHFEIPQDRQGVPTLIVRDIVLVGSFEIEQQFPVILRTGLESGGIGWPAIPGLADIVVDLPPSAATRPAEVATRPALAQEAATAAPTSTTASVATATAEPAPAAPAQVAQASPPAAQSAEPESGVAALSEVNPDAIAREAAVLPPPDPVGFALGWVVLAGLVGALLYGAWRLAGFRPAHALTGAALANNGRKNVLMGLLLATGLVASGYLAYVEFSHVPAVCGPVGECNIVQSSAYASIAGIPVAVLGLVYYLAVAGLWFAGRRSPAAGRAATTPTLVTLALFGLLFSIYLTLLELLVIGAVCAWCLTSAVVSALLFLLVARSLAPGHRQADPQPQAG